MVFFMSNVKAKSCRLLTHVFYQPFWLYIIYSSVTTLKPVLFYPPFYQLDDDIDDEEFYDDHLEAYFEQLAIPGMMYEGLEGQESPENYFKLPASDPSQVYSKLYGFSEIWH